MKPWKLVLGAGAACAACCAVPLITGAAALGLGASGLFAGALAALTAYTGSWVPLAAGGIALLAVAGVVAWRRKRSADAAGACGCSGACGPAPSCDLGRS